MSISNERSPRHESQLANVRSTSVGLIFIKFLVPVKNRVLIRNT